jgi:sugar fermentation stimulation protein A
MDFAQPLQRAHLLKRYKRFLADVRFDTGEETVAHCPNPGAMLGLSAPGMAVFLSHNPSPKRKLAYTLELVEADGGLVGVNTMHPNRLAAEALTAGRVPELSGYDRVRAEVAYGQKSRVDFLLEAEGRPKCWLEIKNVHLRRREGLAEFPDCVAARSARHLQELSAQVAAGDRAVVLFIVQRTDCDRFAPAADLDPAFARAFVEAQTAGVAFLAYDCRLSPQQITLNRRLPILLP